MKTTLLLIVSFIFLVMTACNSEKKESKIQTKDWKILWAGKV